MQVEPLRIYHEHQSSQLCARHCLNNLLQGPYFTEFDLSKIALELDKEEQALLAQDGDENNGLVQWLQQNQSSQNVSDDGNFSIQVLRRALSNLGLGIYHFGHEKTKNAQQHPENEQGFICNLQAHWFAIRRMHNVWYNLNSLSGLPETKAVPTTISNFYLSAFLSTLQMDGYSIFVVRSDTSNWPHLHSFDPYQLLPEYAKWRLVSSIKPRNESYPKHLLNQVNRSRDGQHVTDMGWGNNNNTNANANANTNANTNSTELLYNNDPELAHALALSMDNNAEDDMLKKALAMSMEKNEDDIKGSEDTSYEIVEEPNETEKDCCTIQLRLQNKRIERRFKKEHTLGDVSNFCKSQDASLNNIVFVCPPMNSYSDMGMKLETVCQELKVKKLSFIVKENGNKEK